MLWRRVVSTVPINRCYWCITGVKLVCGRGVWIDEWKILHWMWTVTIVRHCFCFSGNKKDITRQNGKKREIVGNDESLILFPRETESIITWKEWIQNKWACHRTEWSWTNKLFPHLRGAAKAGSPKGLNEKGVLWCKGKMQKEFMSSLSLAHFSASWLWISLCGEWFAVISIWNQLNLYCMLLYKENY